ncbi:hypothetical protein F5876DRAFT_74615 [Lentinula aff. lateritia]|uniref:Uncharacterized protein n=1 Tax=Lentinula aff. lateritia TaxID=2804960 RepID=A0ACC1U6T6_9AGAR|nr:hypothetical protein F5876DRAFT_74615 [Lentinula aff. lateritia]
MPFPSSLYAGSPSSKRLLVKIFWSAAQQLSHRGRTHAFIDINCIFLSFQEFPNTTFVPTRFLFRTHHQRKMPSFRSLFLHLLALCIISSTVPNVVASPIALQVGSSPQAVNTAPSPSTQPTQKNDSDTYSETGSSDNESSHDPEDDTEEPDPEFKNVPIRLWRTKNADFHQWVDSKLATFKGEHWWLCVGKQCYRGDSKAHEEDILVLNMEFVSDNKDLQNLQNSLLIGHITFVDFEHKKWFLRPIQKGKELSYHKTNLEFVEWEIPRWQDINTDSKSDFTNTQFKDLLAKMKAMKNFG